jgi:hypothetical protein
MATKTIKNLPKGPAGSARNERLNSEIPADLDNALRVYCATKRMSRRSVIEDALRTYLNPLSEEGGDATIARRLQRMDQSLQVLTESDRLQVETLGVFVQVALGVLPEPKTDPEKLEFANKVKRRFPRFIDLVSEVLAERSRGLYSYLPKQMLTTAGDFPEPSTDPFDNKEPENDDH